MSKASGVAGGGLCGGRGFLQISEAMAADRSGLGSGVSSLHPTLHP